MEDNNTLQQSAKAAAAGVHVLPDSAGNSKQTPQQAAAQLAQAVKWKKQEADPVFKIEQEYFTFFSPNKRKTIDTADSLNFLDVSGPIHGYKFFDEKKPEQVKEYAASKNAYASLKAVIDTKHPKDLHVFLTEHQQQLPPVVVEKAMAYLASRAPGIDKGDPERGDKLSAFLEVMPWTRNIEFVTQMGVVDKKKSLTQLIHDGYEADSSGEGFAGDPALSKKIAAEIEKLNTLDKAKAAAQSQQQVRQH